MRAAIVTVLLISRVAEFRFPKKSLVKGTEDGIATTSIAIKDLTRPLALLGESMDAK
jgi:hypothetical protein